MENMEAVLENTTYRRLKEITYTFANTEIKSFFTYFYSFLLFCEETGDVKSLSQLIEDADKHCHNPFEMVAWLSNVQHNLFPKETETTPID
jgi:hypothetical protein